MALEELDLLYRRYRLSLYIRDRNEAEGLDTDEKRWQSLGQRMKAAKEREQLRLAIEAVEAELSA